MDGSESVTDRLVAVEWEDITAYSRTAIPEDFEPFRLRKLTCGLLWKEMPEYIVIVGGQGLPPQRLPHHSARRDPQAHLAVQGREGRRARHAAQGPDRLDPPPRETAGGPRNETRSECVLRYGTRMAVRG